METKDANGVTLLCVAAYNNNVDMARIILDSGADPNSQTVAKISAIHHAASHGNLPLLKLLVSRGASPTVLSRNGMSPLHLAAREGYVVEVGEFLVKSGSNINAGNSFGFTPLHFAAFRRDLIDCKEIVRLGGEVDVRSSDGDDPAITLNQDGYYYGRRYPGRTPLHLAALRGADDVVVWFVTKCGVDIDSMDDLGNTPLHCAAWSGEGPTVQLLLQLGSDPRIENLEGQRASDVAIGRAKSVLAGVAVD